jgi:flagellin-specific chaperone FliS
MSKIGGKFYGRGSSGVIMGNPRLPCADESVDDAIRDTNTVSKLYFYRNDYNLLRLGKRIFDAVFRNTTTLKKYFEIPARICGVEFRRPDLQAVYNQEWLEDNNPIITLNDGVYSITDDMGYSEPASKPATQQILNRGDATLTDILHTLRTTKFDIVDTVMCVDGVCHLFEGLCYLHLHKMYHADIKYENIMRFGDVFKFVDIEYFTPCHKLIMKHIRKGEVRNETSLEDTGRMGYIGTAPLSFLYHYFPFADRYEDVPMAEYVELILSNHKWIFIDETDEEFDSIQDVIKLFIPLFTSLSNTLNEEQNEKMSRLFNSLFNFYLMDMPSSNPEQYYIRHTDDTHTIIMKMKNIHSKWKDIFVNRIIDDPVVPYINNYIKHYKNKFLHPDYNHLSNTDKEPYYNNALDFVYLYNDVFTFLFSTILNFCPFLSNSAYSYIHNTIYGLIMTCGQLILDYPSNPRTGRPIDIDDYDAVIKRYRARIKHFRNELHCTFTEYFGDKSSCAVMGGRRRRTKRRHYRTHRKHRTHKH